MKLLGSVSVKANKLGIITACFVCTVKEGILQLIQDEDKREARREGTARN